MFQKYWCKCKAWSQLALTVGTLFSRHLATHSSHNFVHVSAWTLSKKIEKGGPAALIHQAQASVCPSPLGFGTKSLNSHYCTTARHPVTVPIHTHWPPKASSLGEEGAKWGLCEYFFLNRLCSSKTPKHILVMNTSFPSEQERRGACYTLGWGKMETSLQMLLTKIATCAWAHTHNSEKNTKLCVIFQQQTTSTRSACPSASNLANHRLDCTRHIWPGLAWRTVPIQWLMPSWPWEEAITSRACVCCTAEEGRLPLIILWLWCWPHGCLNDGRHARCSVCTDS